MPSGTVRPWIYLSPPPCTVPTCRPSVCLSHSGRSQVINQSFCPPPLLHQSNRPVISAAVQGRKVIILPLSGGVSNDYCALPRPCPADHLSSAVRLSALSVLTFRGNRPRIFWKCLSRQHLQLISVKTPTDFRVRPPADWVQFLGLIQILNHYIKPTSLQSSSLLAVGQSLLRVFDIAIREHVLRVARFNIVYPIAQNKILRVDSTCFGTGSELLDNKQFPANVSTYWKL